MGIVTCLACVHAEATCGRRRLFLGDISLKLFSEWCKPPTLFSCRLGLRLRLRLCLRLGLLLRLLLLLLLLHRLLLLHLKRRA